MEPEIVNRLIDAGGELLFAAVLAGAAWGVRKFKLSESRMRLIGAGIDLAYGAVNEMARKTPNAVDDKAAAALKVLADYLRASGQAPPTAGEEVAARIAFDAKHAAERQVLALANGVPK